jgi:hypothetical protein
MTMKKIISVLAMALLVIGAAQAQNQVRKMVVHKKDGQVVKYNTEYVEDVTFEIIDLPNVPTTIDQAKAMLEGYWKMNIPIDEEEDIESAYVVITEDLKAFLCAKFKDSFTDEEYAGKYIVTVVLGDVVFTSEDPIMFYLGDDYYSCTNLQIDSFELISSDANYPCVRVEPFEYIFLEDGLMKNGLMKK